MTERAKRRLTAAAIGGDGDGNCYPLNSKRRKDSVKDNGGLIPELSKEEQEIYDRQIRLWGLAAQQRLSHTSVILVGMDGMNIEVGKNIALAGIGKIFVQDHRTLSKEDAASHMFAREGDEGKSVAEICCKGIQEFNPSVQVSYHSRAITDFDFDRENEVPFHEADVLIVSDAANVTPIERIKMNEACRAHGVKFFCGGLLGLVGYFFEDLGDSYPCQRLKPKQNQGDPDEYDSLNVRFCSLAKALSKPLDEVKAENIHKLWVSICTVQNLFGFENPRKENESSQAFLSRVISDESLKAKFVDKKLLARLDCSQNIDVASVAAVVGGVLAQEVIKVVSTTEVPYRNVFLYDASTGQGLVENIIG